MVGVAAHPELHDRRRSRPRAHGAVAARDRGQHDVLVALTSEVDHHVGALGRAEQDVLAHHLLGEQRVPGADLDERAAVGESEVVRREVRRVQEPEPVQAGLDPEVRRELPVDEDPLPHRGVVRRRLGSRHPVVHVRPRERVGQLVAGGEAAVGEVQGYVVPATRQVELTLALVRDQEHALQTTPVVAGRPAHPVVVVEAERGR